MCPWRMRLQFSILRILERTQTRELRMRVAVDSPAPITAGQGPRARSQEVEYLRDGELVAICHRYVRADDSIGGSGLPDPKWLWVDGEIWYRSHPDAETCPDCREYRPRALAARDATLEWFESS